jgi:hypothetical protein
VSSHTQALNEFIFFKKRRKDMQKSILKWFRMNWALIDHNVAHYKSHICLGCSHIQIPLWFGNPEKTKTLMQMKRLSSRQVARGISLSDIKRTPYKNISSYVRCRDLSETDWNILYFICTHACMLIFFICTHACWSSLYPSVTHSRSIQLQVAYVFVCVCR